MPRSTGRLQSEFAARPRRCSAHWPCLGAALLSALLVVRAHAGVDAPTIEIHATCEAMAPGACLGAHGFKILPNGGFIVGPGATGAAPVGRLTPAEAQSLRDLANRVLLRFDDPQATCAARVSPVPGVRETVSIAGTGKTLSLYGLGGALDPHCAATGVDDAAGLFKNAHALMLRYYPRPFP